MRIRSVTERNRNKIPYLLVASRTVQLGLQFSTFDLVIRYCTPSLCDRLRHISDHALQPVWILHNALADLSVGVNRDLSFLANTLLLRLSVTVLNGKRITTDQLGAESCLFLLLVVQFVCHLSLLGLQSY